MGPEQALFHPGEHMGGRRHLGKLAIECGEPRQPEIVLSLQCRIGLDHPGHTRMLCRAQQTQDIFGNQRTAPAIVHLALGLVHAVRHSLSLIRLRRNQVRIVLIGTAKRCANSS
ncbi:hypothetical protein D3C87_1819630 [compost metagenome]